MIRVVLDANVFVSAILSQQGAPWRVVDGFLRHKFLLLVSDAILAELLRVLRYPKIARRHGLADDQILQLLEDVSRLSVHTPGRRRLRVIREDPSDDRYLECAVEGGADFLVTGDHHLLALVRFDDVEIVTSSQFVARVLS